MWTCVKNKRGRMGLDIPKLKTKTEMYGKRKAGSALQVIVQQILKRSV